MRLPNRIHSIALLIILASLIPSIHLAWLARSVPHLGAYHDDSIYWVTAQSLAQGKGYRLSSLPGEPFQTKYPPLYPMLLALTNNLTVALWLTWIWLPVLGWLSWRWFRELESPPIVAAVLTAIIAVNPHSQINATRLMADVPGACLLWASILAARRPSTIAAAGAGLLAGMAFLTRTAALPLMAAAPLYLILHKRWRNAAIFSTLSLPFFAVWTLWSNAHAAGAQDDVLGYYTSYVGFQAQQITLEDWPARVWNNVGHLITAIAHLLLLGVGDSPFHLLVRYALVAACLSGVRRLVSRPAAQLPVLFLTLYFLLLLLWYFEPNPRFLYPLLPLLVAGGWTEAANVWGLVKKSFQTPAMGPRVVAAGMCLVLLWVAFTVISQAATLNIAAGAPLLRRELDKKPAMDDAYHWITTNTPGDARFLAIADVTLYLRANRKAVRLVVLEDMVRFDSEGRAAPSEKSLATARRMGLDYMLLTRSDSRVDLRPGEQIPFQAEGPGFRAMWSGAGGVIWRLGE